MRGEALTYVLDRQDRISSVSPQWIVFARDNGASDLTPEAVRGRSLWEFISGPETRRIYELALENVRSEGCSLFIPVRCDSPSLRRFMRLRISPAGEGGIEFHSELVRVEPRKEVSLPRGAAYDTDRRFLAVCSWCGRVAIRDGAFAEIDDALPELKCFVENELPWHSYTICLSCEEMARKDLGIGPVQDEA
jgi:hypothetical protein